jgi:acyl dehydratase
MRLLNARGLEMNSATAAETSWPKVGDKLPPHSFGPFSQDRLRAYAAVSGDDNPMHLDEDIAHRIGLAAPPVHGMLVMSCFAPALAAWRRDLRIARFSGKFVQPLLCGERAEISGRVVQSHDGAVPQVIMRLMAHSQQRVLLILAEATLVPQERHRL